MSIKNDIGLIEKYRDMQEATSVKVKILHDQVLEIVVADLISKYRACNRRHDEYEDSFAKVLRFYLSEDEFEEIKEL